jgi:hypothetical protein
MISTKPFLAIFLFIWFLNLFLPWWTALVPAIIFGAWLTNSGVSAFVTGMAAGGSAWFVQVFYIHLANHAILTTRIADMLQLGSPWLVLLFTFVIGGILTGAGTLFGYHLKTILKPLGNTQTN